MAASIDDTEDHSDEMSAVDFAYERGRREGDKSGYRNGLFVGGIVGTIIASVLINWGMHEYMRNQEEMLLPPKSIPYIENNMHYISVEKPKVI